MAGQGSDKSGTKAARVFWSPYRIATAYVLGLIPIMLVGSDGGWLLFGYIAPFFLFAAVVCVAVYAMIIRRSVAWLWGAAGRIKGPPRRSTALALRLDPLWDRWMDG